MWQTQSVGPVRTAHISVLLTVDVVSHNPAQSSSDNFPFNCQTISITRMSSSGEDGAVTCADISSYRPSRIWLYLTGTTQLWLDVFACNLLLCFCAYCHIIIFFTLHLKQTSSSSLFHYRLLHGYSLDWSHGLPAGPFSLAYRICFSFSSRLSAVD